ncbi:MAG: NnrU family protein [Pseudomonadota bacterium]
MLILATGLALFTVVHLLLGAAPRAAAGLQQRIGASGRKGLIALLSLGGMVLLVMGWRSTEVYGLYAPPAALRIPALLLIAISVYLFVVANRPSAIKRILRHPQLTGLFFWCIGHLALNGDSRSVMLFGWLGAWAVVEMLLISRRDGPWERAPAPPLATDLVTAVVSVVALVTLVWAHPWIAGVAIIPL